MQWQGLRIKTSKFFEVSNSIKLDQEDHRSLVPVVWAAVEVIPEEDVTR